MSDLHRRARAVKSIVDNESLPKWRRATQALRAFGGLELTGLPEDVRTSLEINPVAVNRILASYPLETVDDKLCCIAAARNRSAALDGCLERVSRMS